MVNRIERIDVVTTEVAEGTVVTVYLNGEARKQNRRPFNPVEWPVPVSIAERAYATTVLRRVSPTALHPYASQWSEKLT